MATAYRVGGKWTKEIIELLKEELDRGNYGVIDKAQWRTGFHSLPALEEEFGGRRCEWLYPTKESAGSGDKSPKKVNLPKGSILLFEDEEGQLWLYP